MTWTEITKAEYLDGYRIKVVFGDGTVRTMDFTDVIARYPVFRPLRDTALFRNIKVTDTLEWQDGVTGIAPEYIMEHGTAA